MAVVSWGTRSLSDKTDAADVTNESEALEISVSLLRLQDGTLIDPLTREPMNVITKEVNNKEDEEDIPPTYEVDPSSLNLKALERRSIMDLKLSPSHMAVINNVLVFTVWGMPDDEIATVCNCDVFDIEKIRQLDEYSQMQGALTEGMFAAIANDVQGRLTLASLTAADRIVQGLNSKSGDIRMAAAKDILDRSGHRAADRVEHIHSFGEEAELTIRVTHDSDKDDIPTIDLKSIDNE